MTDMNLMWIDWGIVLVVLISVLVGLAQGFFRSVCSLGGLIAGLAIASWNYRLIAAPLEGIVHNAEIADVIGFILIAVIVMGIIGALGVLLARAFKMIGLGCLDRLAGGVFGFFQGILLVTLTILATVAFYPQARWLVDARLPRHFFAACHLSTHVTPSDLAERVKRSLKMLEGEAPEWMHPREDHT